MDHKEGKNEKTPNILRVENEDIVEGRRRLVEPLGPVSILIKATLRKVSEEPQYKQDLNDNEYENWVLCRLV